MATTTATYSVPQDGRDLARRTTFGVLTAVVAALVVRGVVDALGFDLGAAGAESPFAVAAIVGSTVVAGAGAAVAYAVLDRLTDRPVRNFVALAALVFVGMLVPVFGVAPTMGATAGGQAILVVFHVVVAVPLVAFVTGAVGQ